MHRNLTPRQRLLTNLNGAVPWSQLTPDQIYFRDTIAGGRMAANPSPNAGLTKVVRHADGTCDSIRMEPHGSAFIDLGGKGGIDVAIGMA